MRRREYLETVLADPSADRKAAKEMTKFLKIPRFTSYG
jgi:hypothetical protein